MYSGLYNFRVGNLLEGTTHYITLYKTKLSPARASLLGLSLAKSPQHQHQSQIEYKSDMPTETCFLLDWYYINVSALPS